MAGRMNDKTETGLLGVVATEEQPDCLRPRAHSGSLRRAVIPGPRRQDGTSRHSQTENLD